LCSRIGHKIFREDEGGAEEERDTIGGGEEVEKKRKDYSDQVCVG
jgi:hypothetical protein